MGDTQAPGAAEKELRSDQEHATATPAQVIGSGKPPKRSGSVGAAADAATKRMAAGGGAASADPDLPGDFSRAEIVQQLFASSDLATQIERLGTAGRLAFASHLPAALDGPQRVVVKSVFEATPDGEVATLERLIAAHFAIRAVGPGRGARGVDWDAVALRRAWRVLESLPARTTEGIALQPSDEEEETETADQRADPAVAGNPFLELVRHEIGHVVDGKLQLAERWCVGNPAGGDWRRHGEDARVEVGEGRVLVQGYDGTLASYATEALARRVSDLQFRAPGEWIAEAYAAWRGSVTDGDDRLGQVDPSTRRWLDEEVAPALSQKNVR